MKNKINNELAAYVNERIDWAGQERAAYERQWERNRQIMRNDQKSVFATGGTANQGAPRGKYYAVINRTANAVRNKHGMLTENAVRPVITPHTNDDPCQYILKESAHNKAPMTRLGEVLTEDEYEAMLSQVNPPQVGPDGQQTMPTPVFVPDDFWKISNDMVSNVITTEMQAQWMIGHCDDWLSRSNFAKIVIGHSDAIMEWDKKKFLGCPKTLHALSTWIDPLAENYWNATFGVMRQKLRANVAIARWPEAAEEIKEHIRNGSGDQYRDQDEVAGAFIEYTTMWERDSEMDADEEYAIGAELVKKFEDGTMMNKSGETVSKGSKGWPKIEALRQIEMIGSVELYDGPSTFGDIPLSRNLNLMVVDSPMGIGDPEDLLTLQDLYNRLFTIIHEHLRFYAHPTQVMPASVYNELKGLLDKAFSMPGLKIPVRDQLWFQNNGKVIQNLEMPELNDVVTKVLGIVSQEIDRLSGVTNVLQGTNDAMSGWSGATYQQATANARGPIGAIARNTQYFVQHLARVWMGLIIDNLPSEVWAERNKRYPAMVYDAVKARAANILFEVEVNVSGSSPKAAEAQQLTTMAQTNTGLIGSPTFVKQLMDKANIANGEEIAEELLQNMQQQQAPI